MPGRRIVREAVRDGPPRSTRRPISRRLAEVKGLQNNSIRRLERIEATLDSERNARIDDLALLVELLTEGWRSMNGRLARIEQLLIANLEPARSSGMRRRGLQPAPRRQRPSPAEAS